MSVGSELTSGGTTPAGADDLKGSRLPTVEASSDSPEMNSSMLSGLTHCLGMAQESNQIENAAQKLLAAIGAPAIPFLADRFNVADGSTRLNTSVVATIGMMDKGLSEQTVPLLIQSLTISDEYMRILTIEALEGLGHRAEDAVPGLVPLIRGKGSPSAMAIAALGKIGGEAAAVALVDGLGRCTGDMGVERYSESLSNLLRVRDGNFQARKVAVSLLRTLADEDGGSQKVKSEVAKLIRKHPI